MKKIFPSLILVIVIFSPVTTFAVGQATYCNASGNIGGTDSPCSTIQADYVCLNGVCQSQDGCSSAGCPTGYYCAGVTGGQSGSDGTVCAVESQLPGGGTTATQSGNPSNGSAAVNSGSGGLDTSRISAYGEGIILFINQVLVPILMAVAFFVFIYGVVKTYIFEGESVNKDGHKLILWGIIGFAIIVSFWGLVSLVTSFFALGTSAPPAPYSPY